MNFIDMHVLRVLSEPELKTYNGISWWEVWLLVDAEGKEIETRVAALTFKEITRYQPGYIYIG